MEDMHGLIMSLIVWVISGLYILIHDILHDGLGFIEGYRYDVDRGRWKVWAFIANFIGLPIVIVVVVPPMIVLTVITEAGTG